jgi:30S ribosomal protein S31
MGRGDKRTAKGKRSRGTFGKSRPHRVKTTKAKRAKRAKQAPASGS